MIVKYNSKQKHLTGLSTVIVEINAPQRNILYLTARLFTKAMECNGFVHTANVNKECDNGYGAIIHFYTKTLDNCTKIFNIYNGVLEDIREYIGEW